MDRGGQRRVCVVTGASRGIGRGIALQLGSERARVYITGRSEEALEDLAAEIQQRGGEAVVTVCDHADVEATEEIFRKIDQMEGGNLDLLVNNAYGGVSNLVANLEVPFWQIGPSKWQAEMTVGLRSAYICTTLATKIMMNNSKSGLIVNVASSGGMRYDVTPLYGVRMAALDRMVQDCHIELRKYGSKINMVGLWPGPVCTEFFMVKQEDETAPESAEHRSHTSHSDYGEEIFSPERRETAEFPGLCVRHLLNDKNIAEKSGRVFNTVDLAHEFGFRDVDGKMPVDLLALRNMFLFHGYSIGRWIPEFIRCPKFILTLLQHKF